MKQRQSRPLSHGVIAAIASLVLVVGCDTQRTSEPPQTQVPTPIQTPTPTPTPSPTQPPVSQVEPGNLQTAEFYLLEEKGSGFELVSRAMPLEKSFSKEPEAVLKESFRRLLLLAPQTGSAPNVSSAIPPGTQLRNLTVKGDTVTVDLSQEFITGGGAASMQGRLGQAIYTATSLNPNAKVFLLVEGKPLETLGGEGLVIDQPITREVYQQDFQL